MKRHRQIRTALRRELGSGRLWWMRVVVLSGAAVAGLAVVAFTRLSELALSGFFSLQAAWWWLPLLWTPFHAALIVWVTRNYAAGAAGSGIPQVMACIAAPVLTAQRRALVSLRLSVAKIGLTSWGLLAGLSLGREGPSVQVAAGIMVSMRRWLPRRAPVSEHGLLVAGGAAGIAAAFNTPLGGVMFAIEELSRRPEQRNSGLLLGGIVLAGLVAVSLMGNSTYFGVIRVEDLGWRVLVPGLLVALASGLAGGLFSRLLIASLVGNAAERFNRLRRQYPVRFAAGCGLGVACLGVVTGGATFGSGYAHTRGLLEGDLSEPGSYVLFKFLATWLTAWSGVPAGIFAPSLAIGASLGSDVARVLNYPDAPALIAMGMAGFLAAATQAPLTACIIVMEMVDGHGMVLSLMASALTASVVSRILSTPLYPALASAHMPLLAIPPERANTVPH